MHLFYCAGCDRVLQFYAGRFVLRVFVIYLGRGKVARDEWIIATIFSSYLWLVRERFSTALVTRISTVYGLHYDLTLAPSQNRAPNIFELFRSARLNDRGPAFSPPRSKIPASVNNSTAGSYGNSARCTDQRTGGVFQIGIKG